MDEGVDREELRQPDFPETDEFGNDVSLVECMLLLTPGQRLDQLQRSVEMVHAIRRAGVQIGTIPATAPALE